MILSLCDRTGNMVRPWCEAGYRAVTIDLQPADWSHPMTPVLQIISILEAKMAKAPTKVNRGIPIAGNYSLEDGKLVGKPSRKTSVSKHIQQRKSKKVRPTKRAIGGQRP